MKATYKLLLILLISTFGLFSCEKEITFDLPDVQTKIVIEGSIENGLPAVVTITKSAPYFDPIDQNTLLNSFVRNAIVTVSDGLITEQLQFDTNYAYLPFPFIYAGKNIIGEVGKRYYLKVEVDGKTYTSETSIQNPVSFDSIWFKLKSDSDTKGDVFAVGTDNGAEYNYYRVYTKIIGKDYSFVPIYGSVWDDKFFNGQTFTAQLYHGIASNIFISGDDLKLDYEIGDTVITKLCTLDYESYIFWSAAESEIYSGGNPFSSTTTIPTNIKNINDEKDVLGCWTGYCASYDTIVCH